MNNHRNEIIKIINHLIETRETIFTQIVNLAMYGELSDINTAFDINDEYKFSLSHFENISDVNVQKLVLLCQKTEETIFSLMNINTIDESEVNL